ncbi:response regulator [Rhodobacter maris]|uniref:histidine kinase n=1 Tax=Rhodobacter maris TaxID=446682 RepID=A0A285S5H0_9RHOB|nr:response regulator [Rhodobacter maris]SOC01810.1 histidine kinase/DNA gyrase B/HSP90-like ATPase [Rhodobacter maris]
MNKHLPPSAIAGDVTDPADRARLGRIMLLGHDLRAAVSDILAGLRLLPTQDLDPQTRLQLDRMRAAGEDMARLIEEGIEIVTDQTLGPLRQTVPLARLICDTELRWRARAQEKGLGFQVAMTPDVPMQIRLDRIALERVLSNMLSNAIRHSDRGTVRLMVSCVPATPEYAPGAARLRLAVCDEGPGFTPALLDALRSGGRLPATGGHGLGLLIARQMAERLEADLEVLNRPEGGAELRLSIPLAAVLPAELQIAQDRPNLHGMRVLVAEDSALNRALLAHMLTTLGAECDTADDGVAALERLEQNRYDLALIDVEMPRLSGLELMRALRTGGGRHARLPIVAATAYVLRANRDAIFAAGADAMISKPIDTIDTLSEAIGLALAGRSSAGASTPPAALPLLDVQVFEKLLPLSGPEGPQDLLARVLDDLGRVERGLVTGLSEGNPGTICADAHVLISVAGSLGAGPLRALAEDLARAARLQDAAAMQMIGRSVLVQTDRLIAHVRQKRHELGGGRT